MKVVLRSEVKLLNHSFAEIVVIYNVRTQLEMGVRDDWIGIGIKEEQEDFGDRRYRAWKRFELKQD